MNVRVLFFAHLKDMAGAGEKSFELAEGTTISALAEMLVTSDVRFHGLLRYARPAINGEWATADSIISNGDEIAFLPPSSGG
jgi:molybdopterin converting factor subunit 1